MADSDILRRQHGELLREAGGLVRSLSAASLRDDAEKASASLARISGKLSVHVEAEVASLKEALSRRTGHPHRADVRRFIADLEAMLASFGAFRCKWSDPVSIRTDPVGFMQETRGLLYVITKTIEREDSGLFSLLDSGRPAA